MSRKNFPARPETIDILRRSHQPSRHPRHTHCLQYHHASVQINEGVTGEVIYKAGAVGKNVHVLVRGLVAVYSVEHLSVARKLVKENEKRGFMRKHSRNTGMLSMVMDEDSEDSPDASPAGPPPRALPEKSEYSADVYAQYPYNNGAGEVETEEEDTVLNFQKLIHPGEMFGEELLSAMQDGVMGVGGADAAAQGKSKTREFTTVALTPVKYVAFEAEEYKWINNSARDEIDFDTKMKFLETIGIFSKWTLDKISALAWVMKTVQVTKDQVLLEEGDTSSCFSMIYQGQVDIHVYDKPPPSDDEEDAIIGNGGWGWGGANDASTRSGAVVKAVVDPNAHRTKENLRVTALHRGAYFGETGLLGFFQRTNDTGDLPKEVRYGDMDPAIRMCRRSNTPTQRQSSHVNIALAVRSRSMHTPCGVPNPVLTSTQRTQPTELRPRRW